MFNSSHLHLVLAHFPIVLIPAGLVILLIGLKGNSRTLERTALSFYILSTLFLIAVFLLGEGAEESIEHLKRATEATIESHEESGEFTLWICVVLGIVSVLPFIPALKAFRIYIMKVVLVLALATSIGLAITANRGGRISHPEAYAEASPQVDISIKEKNYEHD